MAKKRLLVLSLSAIFLVGLGVYAYNLNRGPAAGPAAAGAPGKPGAGGPPGGFAVGVETAEVAAADFADEALAVGTLKSSESVVLRPEVAGRVASIQFKDGALVAKGAPLLSLDGAIQEAELQQAKANLALARTNYQRNEELLAKKFVSQQALDSAAANLKVQQAAVQLAEAKLAKTRIKAPFAGVVGLRSISVGDYVKEGQDLVNIEDIAALKVDFRLPESYLGRLGKGQAVELTSDALPGQRFQAVLDALDPLVDQNGRSISCRAVLNNREGRLQPGMFARVRIALGEKKGVLMVPEQAIVSGAAPMLFKVVDGKAAAAKVKLGVRRNAQVEIVDGVAAGDVVVTAGQLKLRDGVPVKAVGQNAPTAKAAPDQAAAPAEKPAAKAAEAK